MDTPTLLQRYMRDVARTQYTCRAVPPFVAFFHLQDALVHFNFAVPDEPPAAIGPSDVANLARVFVSQDRIPRFEFVEEASPDLPALLQECGFHQEDRYPIMTCVASSITTPAWPASL